ncbi:MAG: endonuclease III [Nitrospirota bacterium]
MANGKRITELLLKKYPQPKIALKFSNPLELLVATILSAQCTDVRVNVVTERLFKKYKTAKDYANADINSFEQEIKSTGFYKNKAKMIINAAKKLVSDFGGKIPSTMEELTTLPGVGRKTASVVLSAAFNIPAIAVDTHVLRVSNRLGLVKSEDPEKIEMQLRNLIPENKWIDFSLALILHGRETCKAKKPLCKECVLYKPCKWTEKIKE